MTVETRYRDIPLEEARRCFNTPFYRGPYVSTKPAHWEDLRGKRIQVSTPPVRGTKAWACEGPFYPVIGEDFAVCPHIAEIGD